MPTHFVKQENGEYVPACGLRRLASSARQDLFFFTHDRKRVTCMECLAVLSSGDAGSVDPNEGD